MATFRGYSFEVTGRDLCNQGVVVARPGEKPQVARWRSEGQMQSLLQAVEQLGVPVVSTEWSVLVEVQPSEDGGLVLARYAGKTVRKTTVEGDIQLPEFDATTGEIAAPTLAALAEAVSVEDTDVNV